ncbi:unnamed protein product [Enterobius vermicularis]|uniref:Chitin-binding type-2 domain-containing protein n=1 Tax=Enterobius vermicularis TaxID=51028 RepID=A0A0N4VBI1_ENTVE|nr:unnamed protein product [Enterobius vermicularis]
MDYYDCQHFATEFFLRFVILIKADNEEQTITDIVEDSGPCINGTKTLNEADCTLYFECVNGKKEIRLCNAGTFFNPMEQSCQANYVCPNRPLQQEEISRITVLPELECHDGELRTDPENCRAYYECARVNGQRKLIKKLCPEAYSFSLNMKRCVPGICFGAAHFAPASKTVPSKPTIPPRSNATPCEESSGITGFRADNLDARRYYQCAQGRWIHMDCPVGLHWNPRALVCDWPKKTVCDTKTRCS